MAHIHDLIDFTVIAYIVFKNKVLMIHHRVLNMWLPIGGHIELPEDPEEALYREIKEETGLGSSQIVITGKKSPMKVEGKKYLFPPEYLDIHPYSGHHRHVGMIYFAQATTDRVQLAAAEHHNIRWFSQDDLDAPPYALQADIRYYAQEALKRYQN
jgi:8-oxo-dGTP pyrophosphatase MutT (NUDIX family)